MNVHHSRAAMGLSKSFVILSDSPNTVKWIFSLEVLSSPVVFSDWKLDHYYSISFLYATLFDARFSIWKKVK